jgi:hypothetical protein
MAYIRRSPFVVVLSFGIGALAVLLARGLTFGPLHTDMEVSLVWIRAYGIKGYIERYMDFNQRHVLAGPRNAVANWLFGGHMLPYHLIYQASRILEGALMAEIVHQLTRRRLLAVSVGLALMWTPIRIAALYQSVAWGIETTLVLLLASTYFYLLSLQSQHPRSRWALYTLTVVCYAISVLSYESGIPWVGVNVLTGWFLLHEIPWRQRARRLGLEALPFVLIGAGLTFMVVFVFKPWDDLVPADTNSLPLRVLEQMSTGLTFPRLYLEQLRIAVHDGYVLWMALGTLLITGLVGVVAYRLSGSSHDTERAFPRDFARLILLAAWMLFCSVLIGGSNPNVRYSYLDRITFGRVVGITLLYVTLIFGAVFVLRQLSGVIRARWQAVAMLVTGLVLIGPGFGWLLVYQDEAQAAYGEVDHIANAVLGVRCLFYRPLHVVIVTEPDWVVSRFPDTNDLIIRQAQIKITDSLGDATLDILKTGNEGYEDDYIPPPGTCDLDFPSGMCLEDDGIRPSRWTSVPFVPNEDVVILRYANDGSMTLLPQIDIADLGGYNIATANPTVLKTSEQRLALPFDQMPVPLSGHCPGQ